MDIAVLQFFESIRNGFLNNIFAFFTFFGEETFIVVAICIIYWAINKKTGELFLMTVLSSVSVNGILKDSVRRIRPYQKGVVGRVEIDGFFVNTSKLDLSYSFPSGHSQISGSFFTTLALKVKKNYAYIICFAMIFFVMLSRVFLGVHNPTDVLAGAALGIMFSFLWKYIFNRHYEKRYIIFFVFAAVLSLTLIFSGSADSFKAAGALSGAAIGLFFENRINAFEIQKKLWKKLLRVFIGIMLVLVVKEGLKAIFPIRLIFDYIRYFAVIFTATFIYPIIFKKLDF